ncbi:MAG: ion channel [Dehalococcoidia bacterium]
MQSEERLRRIEELMELPLLALALILIPLLILPSVADLSDAASDAVLAADWAIWAVFAVDFTLKMAVAPHRLVYLRRHWLEAAMVALPFLRPLRAFRVLRLARVGVALGLNVHLFQDLAEQKGTRLVVVMVLLILVFGATLTLLAERQDEASNITEFGDALWWAATTMTTVGYGDRYPVTPMGRGVAVALMLFGIAALSALTATIAAYLVREREEVDLVDILSELRELRQEIGALRAGAGSPGDAGP